MNTNKLYTFTRGPNQTARCLIQSGKGKLRELSPARSLKLRNHSPTGFGSGR